MAPGSAQSPIDLSPGDIFYNLNPGSPRHPWIVASRPTEDGSVVIFNFTTKREGCDEACEIQPQEHPAVHDPTVIAYRRGSLLAPVALQTMRRLGMYSRGERASPDLLRRIQEGDIASEFTPIKLQRFVEEAMESST